MRSIPILAAVIAATAALSAADKPVRTIKGGLIDEARLFVEKLPDTKTVVVRLFSATDADLVEGEKKEETKTLQAEGPKALADSMVETLKEAGSFTTVSVGEKGVKAPADALVIEGKFVELDPGSRAKRAFVGYGAGKSAVKVTGSIKRGDGTLLAEFEQRRVSTIGRDSVKKMTSDAKDIGEDLAKFVSQWAKGKKLD
jgi:hypothetical protein